MSRLRMLLLTTQMEAAGAQKALLELARGLQARGHRVVVATMYDKADYVSRFQARYGLDIVNLRMKSLGERNLLARGFRLVRGVWRLYRLMRQWQADVVQTFSHYSNILGPLVAWLAGVPIRVSSQRMSLRGGPAWLLKLDRIVANSPAIHAMVAVSEGTRRFSIQEEGINPSKIVTIRNGIDLDRFAPLSSPDMLSRLRLDLALCDSSLVVTTVARLHRQKGHRFLIEAIPQVLSAIPRARFLFVGEGELRTELEAMVKEAGIGSFVQFLGVRRDIPEILAISDLLVLPSLWEGLPNSVLEAMAVGLPVIATNVDGCPEVVLDGETGILVAPADSEELARAICHTLENESLRASMGEAARRRVVACFSQQKTTSDYISIYHELMSDRCTG